MSSEKKLQYEKDEFRWRFNVKKLSDTLRCSAVFQKGDGIPEIPSDFIRRIAFALHPPAHGFGEITDDMIQCVISRYVRGAMVHFGIKDLNKISLKKAHEHLAALAG